MSFIYPTNVELNTIAQDKLPRMTKDRPIFELMPIVSVDSHTLRWEQRDNYQGLQQVRGMNGNPTRIKRVSSKVYQMDPGIYGEYGRVDELELTTRRPFGVWQGNISIDDLVMELQDQLMQRAIDRIEKINWDLLTSGTFSVYDARGVLMHTDTYPIQTFGAVVPWATQATSTPLADMRAIQLLSRGHSVNFGSGAVAWMNRTTLNQVLSNTNSLDLAGRRTSGLASIMSPADVNMVLTNEDLPNFRVYDEGYIDENGTFQLYIPNNKVVVMGQRPAGQTIGEYRLTRNANNPGLASGMYTKIVDNGEDRVPRSIEVHHGHNGGPVIYFPSAVVVMTV